MAAQHSVEDPEPLISIAMSVRNNARTLGEAVRSIINQTYTRWELLLLDDGSTDDTVRIARGFTDPRIKVISDGVPLGLPTRLNQAIDLSAGAYFARMDGDDVSYPQRLERQVAFLRAHPEVDLVGTWILAFGAEGVPLGKRMGAERHEEICARPDYSISLPHPTWMGRIGFFRHYRYRQSARSCEDVDLLLRSYRFARFATIPEILLGYREERLDLRKILRTRRYYTRSVVHEFMRQRRPVLAVKGVATIGLKAAVDCVAITSGLDYRVLRHRALPMSADDRRQWYGVWESLAAAPPALAPPVAVAAAGA